MAATHSGDAPSSATSVILPPSNRNTTLYRASHRRLALDAIVSNTGCTSMGEQAGWRGA
jgi:hypothetical protein